MNCIRVITKTISISGLGFAPGLEPAPATSRRRLRAGADAGWAGGNHGQKPPAGRRLDRHLAGAGPPAGKKQPAGKIEVKNRRFSAGKKPAGAGAGAGSKPGL